MRSYGICAGHQRAFPGAIYSDLEEHRVCLDVVYSAKNVLIDCGHRVIEPVAAYDEKRDRDDITHKIQYFNRDDLDCVVEVHLDALPSNTDVEGFHIIHFEGSEGGLDLANTIGGVFRSRSFVQARKPHPMNLPIVRETKAWTVLVECGFLTHEETAKKCKKLSYREKVGIALAEGFMQFNR